MISGDRASPVQPAQQQAQAPAAPCLRKPRMVIGHNLIFKDATRDDAAFILELRTDAKKASHISKTSSDLRQQQCWLENYSNDNTQAYFVMVDKEHEKVGTVRLYDQVDDSFCWGSWIMKQGTPSSHAIESALLVYYFALGLGFKKSHFDVRKGNQSVWKFHERFGADKVRETSEEFFYSISLEAIQLSLKKYKKYLPNGYRVEE